MDTSISEKRKLYYEKNKERFKKRYMQYYIDNKTKINEYNRKYWKTYYASKVPLLNYLIITKTEDMTSLKIFKNVTVTF